MAPVIDIEKGVPQVLENTHRDNQSEVLSSLPEVTEKKQARHDGIYTQILKGQAKEQEPDEFYDSHVVGDIAIKGLPFVAAFQARYSNTRTCRGFRHLTQRLTLLYQSQLTCLHGELVNLDIESAANGGNPGDGGGQAVSFDKEKFISRCHRSPDQISLVRLPRGGDDENDNNSNEESEQQRRDRIDAMKENVVANIERIFERYCRTVNWQFKLQRFPRASEDTQKKFFNYIKKESGLDSDELDYLRAYDDFLYADADTLYERFSSFLSYVRTACIWTAKLLTHGRLFADGNPPLLKGPYSAQKIRLMIKLLMVVTVAALALTPIGILYLGNLPEVVAFSIVALFGLIVGFVLIAFDNVMRHVLLGLVAYLAVLVVFLTMCNVAGPRRDG